MREEETKGQLQNRLSAYVSELIQNRAFISIDVISTLAFTQTTKSYVDIHRNQERAEEFAKWVHKLAVENIKIKHNLKEKEAEKKVSETFNKFFEIFPNFLFYECYDHNISALHNVLKSLLEVEKENEIKNRLESFSEREKNVIAFLIECTKSDLPATKSFDGKIVALDSSIVWGLGKCNQIINHIFKENYGENKSFERFIKEHTSWGVPKIENIPRYEIGDIIVKSGLGFWSPHVQANIFDIDIVFPTWLLMKNWSLPRIPRISSFNDLVIKIEQTKRMEQTKRAFVDPDESEINFDEMNPFGFEAFIAYQLLPKMGYENPLVTRKTGDYGIDIIAKKDDIKIGIQCKKNSPENLVGAQDVQKTLGSMYKHMVDKCILITTSDFTPQAKEQARNAPIELWNRSTLEEKIKKYWLGDV